MLTRFLKGVAAGLVFFLAATACAPTIISLNTIAANQEKMTLYVTPGRLNNFSEMSLQNKFLLNQGQLREIIKQKIADSTNFQVVQTREAADVYLDWTVTLRGKHTYAWWWIAITFYGVAAPLFGWPTASTYYDYNIEMTLYSSNDAYLKTVRTAHKDTRVRSLYVNGNKTVFEYGSQVFDAAINDAINRLAQDEAAIMAAATAAGPRRPPLRPSEPASVYPASQPAETSVIVPYSDVDKNIPVSHRPNPDAIAVVIGNQHYQGDIPPVDYAIQDATAVRYYLINTLGYQEGNILAVNDATQAKFLSLFGAEDNPRGRLYNLVKPNLSDVFIYYSGHGAPDSDSSKAFFVPVDADPNSIKLNGYPLDTFYRNLGRLPARRITVVIDACFSGASQQGMIIKAASPIFVECRAPLSPNTCALMSGAEGQISSWFPDQRHGLFTYFFLKGLRGAADLDGNKTITFSEMHHYLSDSTTGVPYWARRLHNREQIPAFRGDPDGVLVVLE